MGTEAFSAGAGCNIVSVGFRIQRNSGIVLNRAGDELRSRFHRLLVQIIFVFQHISSIRKVTENFLDEMFLIPSDRRKLFGVIDFLHAITSSDIFCVPATPLTSAWFQKLKLRD